MSENSDRLREHPEQRFDAKALRYDLNQEAESLQAKASADGETGHRQVTLYKGSDINSGPTTIALFDFDAGAALPAHLARGVVSIHVLAGRIEVAVASENHELVAGQILLLQPEVRHDVRAIESSRMLLTVCLEPAASAEDRNPDGH